MAGEAAGHEQGQLQESPITPDDLVLQDGLPIKEVQPEAHRRRDRLGVAAACP